MDVAERFWAKVDKDGRYNDEIGNCWEWTGGLNSKGYGQLRLNGKMVLSHRYSYVLHHPDDDFDLLEHREICVCHTCDNPRCVNPAHLFLGSHTDNMRDKEAKGRGKHSMEKGEKHPASKLTETQVREIRTKYANGGTSHQKLGVEYGVGKSAIGKIISRKTWNHLE